MSDDRILRDPSRDTSIRLPSPSVEGGEAHPEATCQRCGRPNVWSWHAPSPLWNAVLRDPANSHGYERGWNAALDFVLARLGHPGESQPWTMNPHTGRLLLESAQTIIRDSHRYDTRTVEMASYIVAAAGDLVVALRETLAVSAPSEASEGLSHPGESQP